MSIRVSAWRRWLPLLLVAIATPLVFGAFKRARKEPNGATVLGQVLQIVTQRALDSLPDDSVYIRAARGLVNSIDDPYASLYDRKEIGDFMRNTIGNSYGGLGMGINQEDSTVVVSDVFPQSPAERGGVERGDLILAIDSTRVVGWSTDKVSQHLTGPVGTPVVVTFQKAGVPEPVTTKFTRAAVHAAAVPYTLMVEDHIGYIPLQRFNATAGEELADAVKSLQARGATRFVVDLRGNGGGDVDQAVKVANVFLPRGKEVATQRERNVPPKVYTAASDPTSAVQPVAVLVDGGTASASEIVAGALQDHDRALIVGTRTFGKGLVQAVYNLDGGFALKITTGKWYTPSGRSIHRDRKLVDGRLVLEDTTGDTTAVQITHSDAGRRLVGRGGISPDVAVQPDTLTTREQALVRVAIPHAGAFRAAIFDEARDQHGRVASTFQVTPALRDDLRQRLAKGGITFSDTVFTGGSSYLDELLTQQTLGLALGDSAATRHRLTEDPQMRRAVDMLRKAATQIDLIKELGA
jgi:carboxyl-terminal processing protease